MNCPRCRQPTEVVKTEPSQGGAKARLRRCRQHGRFWTRAVERVTEWLDEKTLPATLPATAIAVSLPLPPSSNARPSDPEVSVSSLNSTLPLEDQSQAQTPARVSAKARAAETPEFAAFYAAYPRKEKRPQAFMAWKARGCQGIAAAVMAGLVAWLPSLQARPADRVPHPASWLNGEQWNDQPPAPGRGSNGTAKGEATMEVLREFMARGEAR